MRSFSVSPLTLPEIVDIRLGQFVLEESLVVVPGRRRWTIRQPRQIFLILDRLGSFSAALCGFGEQSEIEALDRLAALVRQFCADAAFVFEPGDLVASGASDSGGPTSCLRLSTQDRP